MCSSQSNFVVRTPSLAVGNSTAHTHDGNLGLHLVVMVEDNCPPWYRGLVLLYNSVMGDTWIKIQAEQRV